MRDVQSPGQEVVRHVEAEVHVEGLVVEIVLERLLATRKFGFDLTARLVVAAGAQLGGELRLERPLDLDHQLGAGVAP